MVVDLDGILGPVPGLLQHGPGLPNLCGSREPRITMGSPLPAGHTRPFTVWPNLVPQPQFLPYLSITADSSHIISYSHFNQEDTVLG